MVSLSSPLIENTLHVSTLSPWPRRKKKVEAEEDLSSSPNYQQPLPPIFSTSSTISSELGGAPFGNVVSFSDGFPDKGYGTPYFYLTTLDPTARNALKDARSSFTISEFPIGTCGKKDPENPTCAKLTLTGKLKIVEKSTKEAEFAESALFTKHAEMKDWPKKHDFQIFKLDVEDIFFINWFGGPKPLSVAQYLQPRKRNQPAAEI